MNPKELEKLAKFKQEMQGEEEPAEINPLAETLDYHEHIEQRHKNTGHKVMDAMFGDKREKVETWADQIEGKEVYESWAEKIVENKDAYYVAGQKLWLASEGGKHQSNPVAPIIDGFMDEQLSGENETWRNLRDKNPKGFEELQNRLTVFVGRKMEDVEFTPEDQHVLKFQALQEFMQDEQDFGSWVTQGIISSASPSVATALEEAESKEKSIPRKYEYYSHPPTLRGRVYTEKWETKEYRDAKSETAHFRNLLSETTIRKYGKEILEEEGFISSEQELDDAQSIAKQIVLEENADKIRFAGIKPILDYYGSKRQYHRLFGLTITTEDLVSAINSGDERYAGPHKQLHEKLAKGYYETSGYHTIVNPLDLKLSAEQAEGFRDESYGALFNILLLDGRSGPGETILSRNREFAANNYFKAFDYSEHMDELNDRLSAKLEELHGNGQDDQAKLLKRRFRQWSQNKTVASTFQEYNDLVMTRKHREEQDPRGNNLQVWHDTPVSDVLEQFDKIYGNRDDIHLGNRFQKAHGIGVRGEGDGLSESHFMPRDVARERINALKQWKDFIQDNIPDADLEEALMVFDSNRDTLDDAMNHLDGNTYSVISFNYRGKRCMIAECLGVSSSGASPGAMKIWMGELGDKRGWETAFNRSKSEAAARGDCESISHTNIVSEVINRENDDGAYIVEGEDIMFHLAFRYFESDGTNKNILRNNAENRQQIADFIGPEFRRPNPGPAMHNHKN